MPIVPLPQFEADLAVHLREQADRDAYERLNAPTSLVVRFGLMQLVGEFGYDGSVKPGCGSKIVVQTHRGVELGEMLTSTCPNSGCSKSVSRREMLRYIENSGGKDYPFFDERVRPGGGPGVLRIASGEDMHRHEALRVQSKQLLDRARALAQRVGFANKLVQAETILGGGFVAYYYRAEERTDHGPMLGALRELHAGERVELRPLPAREEARLTADYERCGQYCCCKNFLKVLKPVSMRMAKVQKATLDPLKISGRCGRLMCCLRYEDETYRDLKAKLPHRKTRVGTPHGDGLVLDGQILTQLVLVQLDNGERVAVPVEELTPPAHTTAPPAEPTQAPPRPHAPPRPQASAQAPQEPAVGTGRRKPKQERQQAQPTPPASQTPPAHQPEPTLPPAPPVSAPPSKAKFRRRGAGKPDSDGAGPPQGPSPGDG